MARRKIDPGVEFSLNDLAVAAGLKKRVIQLLSDNDTFERLTHMEKLNKASAIGAICTAYIPPILAEKIIKLLINLETNSTDIPSRFNYFAKRLSLKDLEWIEEKNDYYIHRALMECPEIYRPGIGERGDFVVEIVDGKLVFTGHKDVKTQNTFDNKKREMHFSGWITATRRGAEPDFVHLAEKFNLSEEYNEITENYNPKLAMHEQSMQACRENAVSRLMINLSLAVRNGYDRLHAYRFGKNRLTDASEPFPFLPK